MTEPLSFIDPENQMPDPLRNDIRQHLHVRKYDKNTVIVRPGRVNTKMLFIAKGSVRCYKPSPNASSPSKEKINRRFLFENDAYGSIGLFLKNIPETQFVQALQLATIIEIAFEDLLNIFGQKAEYQRYMHTLFSRPSADLEKIADMLRMSSAQEKYDFLANAFPHLPNQITQRDLASFMGITPETLNRITTRHR
jgi:CRP-like cAMP-binding protein